MELRLITKESFFSRPPFEKRPWQENYLAMYSSQWHGFVTDPDLMLVPVDDHLVHRGDGVFDVIRCVNGRIYQMEAHLKRLERSAKAIALEPPPYYNQIREIIKYLIIKGGEADCLVRVILSRGPGSFTTNPYDCHSAQIYVNVIKHQRIPDRYYQEGIPIMTSQIPAKKSFYATIKSCNYLPNVLMKMEAVDHGYTFSVALDEDGFLAEGSTENIGVVSVDGFLKFPGFEKTLAGITVDRIFNLARTVETEGGIRGVQFANISLEEAYRSSEILLTGTSINIIPVVALDGKPIGTGSPGPVYSRLASLLWEDMTTNQDLLTELE